MNVSARAVGKLNLQLQGSREIVFTRLFQAPRELVFAAMTQPELVKRWLNGAPGWSLDECEIDARKGGSFRYLWRKPGNKDMSMRGVFLDMVPPERITQTEVFDDAWYPGEAVGTCVLEENGSSTLMTLTMEYASGEAREIVLRTPMEQGMAVAYDSLEELLASQQR